MTDPVAEATAEIQRLHDIWFEANIDLKSHLLPGVFAGERFFDYNLNGYRYDGVSEMEKLWEPAHMKAAFEILELANIRNKSIVATADIGWLTLEADCVMKMITGGMGDMGGEGDLVTLPFRITECYRRDDGNGNSEWRMWHFHCSPERTDVEKRFDPA
ncbi:hypothetical protein [Sphingobium aquiterrae]|uniref:hypothetical protein n=1 Tax=Sphingobium aquiterrae TaxID=2038656 RepID=UPI003018FD1A